MELPSLNPDPEQRHPFGFARGGIHLIVLGALFCAPVAVGYELMEEAGGGPGSYLYTGKAGNCINFNHSWPAKVQGLRRSLLQQHRRDEGGMADSGSHPIEMQWLEG